MTVVQEMLDVFNLTFGCFITSLKRVLPGWQINTTVLKQVPLVALLLAWHWPHHHSPAYRPSPSLERPPPNDRATCQDERSSSAPKHWCVKAEINPSQSSFSLLLVCLSPPLIRLGWVWVDADGSVTVSDGSVGLLHFHIYAERHKQTESLNSQSNRVAKNRTGMGWYLALLAYRMASFGLSLMASAKRSTAFCRSPEKLACLVEPHCFIRNY